MVNRRGFMGSLVALAGLSAVPDALLEELDRWEFAQHPTTSIYVATHPLSYWDAILKEIYSEKNILNLTYKARPIFRLIPDGVKGWDVKVTL